DRIYRVRRQEIEQNDGVRVVEELEDGVMHQPPAPDAELTIPEPDPDSRRSTCRAFTWTWLSDCWARFCNSDKYSPLGFVDRLSMSAIAAKEEDCRDASIDNRTDCLPSAESLSATACPSRAASPPSVIDATTSWMRPPRCNSSLICSDANLSVQLT